MHREVVTHNLSAHLPRPLRNTVDQPGVCIRDAYRGDLIMLWLHVYVIIHLHYTGHFSKQVLLKVKYKYKMNKYINKRKNTEIPRKPGFPIAA